MLIALKETTGGLLERLPGRVYNGPSAERSTVTEPEPPESIDFEANKMDYVRDVMADNIDPGRVVYVSDGVWLFRLHSERNLWEVVLDGDGIETFDADMVETSAKLGMWIRRRVAVHRDGGSEDEQVGEEPLPGGFQ